MNPYEILGVSQDASLNDIKSAYRRLSMAYHPDRENGNNDIFLEVQKAYEILSDPVKREAYDTCGETDGYLKLDNQARDVLATIYKSIIKENDYAELDYIQKLKNTVQLTKNETDRNLQVIKDRRSRINYIYKNTAADEVVLQPLEEEIAKADADIESGEHFLKVLGRALIIADSYKYTGDTGPEVKPTHRTWPWDGV